MKNSRRHPAFLFASSDHIFALAVVTVRLDTRQPASPRSVRSKTTGKEA